jgi:hypothetical protein
MKRIIWGILVASLMANTLNAMKRQLEEQIEPISKRQKTTIELGFTSKGSELLLAVSQGLLSEVERLLEDGGAEIASEYYYSFNVSLNSPAGQDHACIYLVRSSGSNMVTAHYWNGAGWVTRSVCENNLKDFKHIMEVNNSEGRLNAHYIHQIVCRFGIVPPPSMTLGLALVNAANYGYYDIFEHILTQANLKISIEEKGRALLNAIQKKHFVIADILLKNKNIDFGEKYIFMAINEALNNGDLKIALEQLLPLLEKKKATPHVLDAQRELVLIKAAEVGDIQIFDSIMLQNWQGITKKSESKALLAAAHKCQFEMVWHIIKNQRKGLLLDYCWLLAEPSMKHNRTDILGWLLKQPLKGVSSNVLKNIFDAAILFGNLDILKKLPLKDETFARFPKEIAIAQARKEGLWDVISYMVKETGHHLSSACLGGIFGDAAEKKDSDLVLSILNIKGFYENSRFFRIRALDSAIRNEDAKMVDAIMDFSFNKLKKEENEKYKAIMGLKTEDILFDNLKKIIGDDWDFDMIKWLLARLTSISQG